MEVNEVGGVYEKEFGSKSFTGEPGRQVMGFKASRRVGTYLGLEIGENEINFLSALYLWNNIMNKGGGLERFIDWTGYSSRWKGIMYNCAKKCVQLELVCEKSVKGGKRIVLTEKGIKVLKTYSNMLEIVRMEELAKGMQGKEKLKAVA